MSTQSSVVYHEIKKIFGNFFYGLARTRLSCLKTFYQLEFTRPLDYEFLGVKDAEELLDVMHKDGMVLFYEDPESKETYVMSVDQVEYNRESLRRDVDELLEEYHGEIPLGTFDDIYKEKFMLEVDYHLCCLENFRHLCEVSNLVVDGAKLKRGSDKGGQDLQFKKKRRNE